MAKATSFRLDESVKDRLMQRAEAEGTSATALLERLIREGVDSLDFPGIVHRGPDTDRRPAIAGGPDVWEVIARLRQLTGAEEERIADLVAETNLHATQIRLALEYASRWPQDVESRIDRNERAIAEGRAAAETRQRLLA